MIPHRMQSGEMFAGDLKGRVIACRKRLRLNRIHRVHFDNQLGELICETAIEASDFYGGSEDDTALRESLIRVRDEETSQRVNQHDEQEVGIT